MAKKKPDPYATQAQNITTSRYGPEISALAALMRQAEEDRDTSYRQAKTGRQFTVGAVDQARPQITQAYRGAAQAIQPAFAQGGGIESAALGARMGEAGALAQSQLAARRVSAVEGEQAARVQAQRNFTSDRAKIGQRATDLARESGAFTASTIQDLIGADTKAATDLAGRQATLTQQERNSQRSAGIDPDTGQPIPGGKLDPKANKPKGAGWASQEAQTAAGSEISRLINAAKGEMGNDVTRADVADLLRTGIPKASKVVYENVPILNAQGKPTGRTKRQPKLNGDGTPVTVDDPGVDAAKSQLLLTAALDMAYDHHLSRRTQDLLHRNRIQIAPLGLVTFNDWLKTPEGQEWRRRQSGYTLPTAGRQGTAKTRDQQLG
jgi:hypothetical protein